jgi:AcrR family transcriptional regulator
MSASSTGLTKTAVLQEAARLFAREGYDNTRMRDISEKFGVTHAALYYHFSNKQEILQQLNSTAINGLMGMIVGIERDQSIDVSRKFDHAVHGHVHYVTTNIDVVSTLFNCEHALPSDFLADLQKQRRTYTDKFVALFRAGQSSGRFIDVNPVLAVQLILGSGTWVHRWYREGGTWSPQFVADTSLSLLSTGYEIRHNDQIKP